MKTSYGDATPKIFTSLPLNGSPSSLAKHLFNDGSRKKTEPVVTLYKIVLENDIIIPDTFNKNVLSLV